MSVFRKYAEYYDLLYADKDYAGEAEFVLAQLGHVSRQRASLLELGCGSGRHAIEFAQAGLTVCGIDSSAEMVARAQDRLNVLPDGTSRPTFSVADVRTANLGTTFQYVVSLFHVFSYQVSNADLQAAFQTAAHHLAPGGRFFFDFWYGPAVLRDPPVVRVRRLRGSDYSVTRIAEPSMRANDNCVEVRYEVLFESDADVKPARVKEVHAMRYLFLPEIAAYLSLVGLRITRSGAWMVDAPLCDTTWYGWVMAQRDK